MAPRRRLTAPPLPPMIPVDMAAPAAAHAIPLAALSAESVEMFPEPTPAPAPVEPLAAPLAEAHEQVITERYALYRGDCIAVMAGLPTASVHLSVYSPPFPTAAGGLYTYSSDERDLSNNDSWDAFFAHYEFVVAEIARVTMPGRITAVHCMDVPSGNSGRDYVLDFPGAIIALHERLGFRYIGRRAIWKEPLAVRNRTLAKGLAHRTIVEDATMSSVANADYLLAFRRDGENAVPVANPTGLLSYAGERQMPAELLRYRGWTGKQTENRFSHWIWRQYASAFWDDIRIGRVLPYREARDAEDEKHVHPLQLDVIERAVTLWSNVGETVLTPFMGVGSEVYQAVRLSRRGIGAELKASYFRQAVRNLAAVDEPEPEQAPLLLDEDDAAPVEPMERAA